MLTPSDIEQKTFHTSLRGYDLHEVDDFLDQVVATIRELTRKLESAQPSSPSETPAGDESAVGRALVAAQTAADQMIAEARAESDKILEDAKSEAESWAAERDERKAAAAEEMVELSKHVAAIRTQLAVLATAVADRLDEMDEALKIESALPQETADDDDASSGDAEADVDEIVDLDDAAEYGYADEAVSNTDDDSDDEEHEADADDDDPEGDADWV